MFGVKATSVATLPSRQWSQPELGSGLDQLLGDLRSAKLPDSLEELQAVHRAFIVLFFLKLHPC